MFYTESHNIGPLLYVITCEGKYYFTVSVKKDAMNSNSGERQLDRIRDATICHGHIWIGLTAADSFRQYLPSGVGTQNDQNDFLCGYRITSESQLWSFAYVRVAYRESAYFFGGWGWWYGVRFCVGLVRPLGSRRVCIGVRTGSCMM
jgi:hypothetical protein